MQNVQLGGARPRWALQGLSPEALAERVPEVRLGEARKIVSRVMRGAALGEPVPTVRRVAIEAAARACHVPTLQVREVKESALDPFVKWLLQTHDGHLVEAVRIPLLHAGRVTVCVSSQVGCALGCTFCATGRLGLGRNLEAWEIVEQVRIVRASLTSGRVHGVVFQGMGEALSNLERVLQAIAVMTSPSALAIDQRTITVSTAGLPAGIRQLAVRAPKVRLAWSVGSARPEVRGALMPIHAAHGLDEVLDAGVEHARVTGLAPLWAVTLLHGVNDTDADMTALGELAQRFTAASGHRPRVTFIPYNATDEDAADPFRTTPFHEEDRLRAVLAAYGVFPHRRYSGGADVGAACGQLASRTRP